MPARPVPVRWEIAADDSFRRVVQHGQASALPDLAHSVHVEVAGLSPAREYFYRFIAGGEISPIGRAVTAPALGAANSELRFAFVSCQHFENGYYTAYHHLAADNVDLIVHLGDYIYENGIGAAADVVRRHDGDEIKSLQQYRNRLALYKSDRDLQNAHASAPFVCTWDDHEVDNNYAAMHHERGDPIDAFERRRAAGYQAYYEHMPLRTTSLPRRASLQLYRGFTYGSLASFHVLDTRQFRTDQPCGDGSKAPCAAVFDEKATLLGPEQERWLFERFNGSRTRWNVLPQQVMIAPVDREEGAGERLSMDQWSGYQAARTRLLQVLARRRLANPVVLTGDIHSNWVNDLKVDFLDPKSPVVATELVGTSIASGGDGVDVPPGLSSILAENPFVKFYNEQRGYVVCDVTSKSLQADYRVLDYVSRPGSPRRTRASFVVEDGRPGAQAARS
jgi:alkaline phosphatase D